MSTPATPTTARRVPVLGNNGRFDDEYTPQAVLDAVTQADGARAGAVAAKGKAEDAQHAAEQKAQELANAKGTANGIASLDGAAKVPASQMPDGVFAPKSVQTTVESGRLSPEVLSSTIDAADTYLVATGPRGGMRGDGRVATDVSTTSGSAVVTSATIAFTSADVGKIIMVSPAEAGSNPALAATIASVQSATQATATTPATATIANGIVQVGSDNTPAWNTTMAALANRGGTVSFPSGIYLFAGVTDVVPGGVTLLGTGINYGAMPGSAGGSMPRRNSILRAASPMTRLVELGRNPNASSAADTGASMRDLIVDGQNLATYTVQTAGRRNYVTDCHVLWGISAAIYVFGQNSYIRGGVQQQDLRGDCILVDGGRYDDKIFDAQQRGMGATGAAIRVRNSGDLIIRGNHMWAGQDSVPATAQGLIVIEGGCSTIGIYENIIEGVDGPEILLTASTGDIGSINISSNQFFNNTSSPDNTYSVVQVDGTAGHYVTDVVIASNIVRGFGGGRRYKSLIGYSGALTGTRRFVITGNECFLVAFALTGSASAPDKPKWANNSFFNGTSTVHTENAGTATMNGDGTKTVFTIAHSLAATPSWCSLTPGSNAAMSGWKASFDGTNIIVTFTTAPAAGTGNVVFMWSAGTQG